MRSRRDSAVSVHRVPVPVGAERQAPEGMRASRDTWGVRRGGRAGRGCFMGVYWWGIIFAAAPGEGAVGSGVRGWGIGY
jgi:hypothetical protein